MIKKGILVFSIESRSKNGANSDSVLVDKINSLLGVDDISLGGAEDILLKVGITVDTKKHNSGKTYSLLNIKVSYHNQYECLHCGTPSERTYCIPFPSKPGRPSS
jgi:hypothetical protein